MLHSFVMNKLMDKIMHSDYYAYSVYSAVSEMQNKVKNATTVLVGLNNAGGDNNFFPTIINKRLRRTFVN